MQGEGFDDCQVRRATEKALCVFIPDLGKEVWIPRKVIHGDSEVFDDHENSMGRLVVFIWFAYRNKWR